jgi:hypothetical protein
LIFFNSNVITLNIYYEVFLILKSRDWGKSFRLEKNHTNKKIQNTEGPRCGFCM